MPHAPVHSARTPSIRLLAALLAAALGGAALLHGPASHLTSSSAPARLAGDNDKGGMGGG